VQKRFNYLAALFGATMNEFSPVLPKLVEPEAPQIRLNFSFRRLRLTLWTFSIATIALGLFHQWYDNWWGGRDNFLIEDLLNFDGERSLPTLWSVLLLAFATFVIFLNGIAEPQRRWRSRWFLLAGIFLFLTVDEFSGIHEQLVSVLAPFGFTGFLLFSWVIPYAAGILLIAGFYAPFILALPGRVRWRVILAGGVYIGSALGLETIGGYCTTIKNKPCVRLEVIGEESGEILAMTLFILAMCLLLQLRSSRET
jgi:hypothetical protein